MLLSRAWVGTARCVLCLLDLMDWLGTNSGLFVKGAWQSRFLELAIGTWTDWTESGHYSEAWKFWGQDFRPA